MSLSDAQKKATRKYNNKTYRDFRTPIRKELFDEINNWCKNRGISRAEFIRRAWTVIKKGE